MAKAPKPKQGGYEASAEADRQSQQILTITIKREIVTEQGRVIPETHTLAANLLPVQERIACRKATGLPLEAFTEGEAAMGMDSIVVLWWLARRMNGEALLPFAQAAKQWPNDLSVDEIEVEVGDPDPEATDPEA